MKTLSRSSLSPSDAQRLDEVRAVAKAAKELTSSSKAKQEAYLIKGGFLKKSGGRLMLAKRYGG